MKFGDQYLLWFICPPVVNPYCSLQNHSISAHKHFNSQLVQGFFSENFWKSQDIAAKNVTHLSTLRMDINDESSNQFQSTSYALQYLIQYTFSQDYLPIILSINHLSSLSWKDAKHSCSSCSSVIAALLCFISLKTGHSLDFWLNKTINLKTSL